MEVAVKRKTTCIQMSEPIFDAIDKRAAETGAARNYIIEQALILSGLLELPHGITPGMGRRKRGRKPRAQA